MDVVKPFIRHFAYDFYLRRDGFRLDEPRRQLAMSQFCSADELAALQLMKLQNLLAAAYTENSFYRNRFDQCGFEPGDLREFSDLAKLPILTKDDIRDQLIRNFSHGYTKGNLFHKRTGGSTGVPLHVYIDYEAISQKMAATERHNEWAGLVPGNHLAAVWGDTSKSLPLKERIRHGLTTRAFYLDTLKFNPQTITTFIDEITRHQPPVLIGHAHSIFRLAEYVRDSTSADISFDGVITTAMVLSNNERQVIEETFNSKVFNRYGCEELSIIASECSAHDGMHIFAEGLYLELIGANEREPRPLVITDLTNRAMPLIRYEIGDYGVMADGNCQCGRHLPRLLEVSGRTADFLYTPEGERVFGISILDTFVIHIPGIRQAQLVQDQYDHIDLYVVKENSFSAQSTALIQKNMVEIFGPGMKYDLHYVDQIQQTGAGKYRFSICNVPASQD